MTIPLSQAWTHPRSFEPEPRDHGAKGFVAGACPTILLWLGAFALVRVVF